METCPECGSESCVLDERHDEWVCNRCGLAFDAHSVHSSAPPVPVPVAKGRLSGRLAKVDKQSLGMTSSELRLRDAVAETRRIADAVGCPLDIVARSSQILRAARKAGLTQGRKLEALAAASLLAACRMLYLTRPPQDMAAASPVSESEIQAAYKAIVTGLRLPVPTMSAFQYLGQIATKAGIPEALVPKAQAELEPVCGTARAGGKNPLGWAVAALVRVAQAEGLDMPVSRVAKTAGVSASTVAARMADLEEAASMRDD